MKTKKIDDDVSYSTCPSPLVIAVSPTEMYP